MTQSILVVGPSWVGDMVMAQVLFRLLKHHHPSVHIDVLAPAWSRPLLVRMPEVRRAIDLPFGHGKFAFFARRAFGKSLIEHRYDQAIVLPNSWKSALIPFFADIPQRTGWRGEMRFGLLNDQRRLDKKRYPLMIERFAALAYARDSDLPEHLPWPEFTVQPVQIEQALHDLKLAKHAAPILALCPGAEFGPSKRWPEKHFADIARHYLALGWQVWIFGSANDSPVAEAIRAQCAGVPLNLAGKTNLAQAIDLLSLATQVVSNDSGLMHIAAALQRPLVVPYGSTSPQFTPPLSHHVRVLRTGIACSPCFKRECPLGHQNCLNELMPSTVIAAIDDLQQDVHTLLDLA